MRKRVPKMKNGSPYMSDMDRKIAAKRKAGKSKRLRKAQNGTETAEGTFFNPMLYGDSPIGGTGTNYVSQVFGTGPGYYGDDQGIGTLNTRSGSGMGFQFPGAPDPSMYGGNQRAYIKALNKFGRQTAKDYRDVYTGGVNPSRISTSRLGDLEGAGEYQQAYNKLYGYINSEIAGIDQANELVGRRGRNKRTKGRGNKNRLFR